MKDMRDCVNAFEINFTLGDNESKVKNATVSHTNNQHQFISSTEPTSMIAIKIQTCIQHHHTRDINIDIDVVHMSIDFISMFIG